MMEKCYALLKEAVAGSFSCVITRQLAIHVNATVIMAACNDSFIEFASFFTCMHVDSSVGFLHCGSRQGRHSFGATISIK
jgi:hypothetical protein